MQSPPCRRAHARTGSAPWVVVAASLVIGPTCSLAAEIAVDVSNRSEPTLCAEHDNVTLAFSSDKLRRFRIEAAHPAYIGSLLIDRAAPDLSHCNFASENARPEPNQRLTLYETEQWQLVALRMPSFWRRADVPVRIGDRVESGLHLLQLWHRFEERAEEVLAMYPPDGYWRARPLPPAHLRWSAYGSSFLVGPVEVEARPFVGIRSMAFDAASLRFTMNFVSGGGGEIRLESLDREHIVLDIALDPVTRGPFAALRSMFVTETNADVARMAWREPAGRLWHEAPVMEFSHAGAVELWAGRAVLSRHNSSAPDLRFANFSD
jgi:hypothetical protein